MNEILLANALLTLLERQIPIIEALAKRGEVSAEEQQQLHNRYAALRARGDAAFKGPAWEA